MDGMIPLHMAVAKRDIQAVKMFVGVRQAVVAAIPTIRLGVIPVRRVGLIENTTRCNFSARSRRTKETKRLSGVAVANGIGKNRAFRAGR